MGSWTVTFCALLSVCYVTQSLRCFWCQDISESPNCKNSVEECSPSHTHCLRMELQPPAYGIIRRCATLTECDTTTEPRVVVTCCDTDFCN
ncbi:CD59 glycoprotein-like [Arapaima gigas]